MSQDDSEQNKSEEATPFKLNRAREKGSVARGMDLGFLAGAAAFTGFVWMLGASAVSAVTLASRRTLASAASVSPSAGEILAATGALFGAALRPFAFLTAAIFLTVIVLELIQVGPVFSTEPLRLDFSRLNPATGLKRLFTVRLLVETAKGILKLAVYGALAFVIIRSALAVTLPTITSAGGLSDAIGHNSLGLLFVFLGAAGGFAALDQMLVRREFGKKMRMSRREIRRESRDREGDPKLKQKRKSLHREFVQASESLRGVKGADVLITNPTHFAVALRYDQSRMAAPQIVSRGANMFAMRLRRLAFSYGVVIVSNPPLARALFRCELNSPVPEALYPAVATLYRALRSNSQSELQSRQNV